AWRSWIQLPWVCIAPILVHEFPNLAFFPLLANECHPAIGRAAVREETDAPAEQGPERPVDFRGDHETDGVQDDVDRCEDSAVEIECPDLSDTAACTLVPIPIVGYWRRCDVRHPSPHRPLTRRVRVPRRPIRSR